MLNDVNEVSRWAAIGGTKPTMQPKKNEFILTADLLFNVKIPGIELGYGVMGCHVKLYRYNGGIAVL